MVSKNSRESLKCSTKVHKMIMTHVKNDIIEDHPEIEGMNITANHLLTQMLKDWYGDEYDKFDEYGDKLE